MELRDYIEAGAKKAGSLTALGNMLHMSQPTISQVKAHKRPLPTWAVIKLSEYLECDLKALLAANELVTEKRQEVRDYLTPFAALARAASIAGATMAFAVTMNLATPSPADASEYKSDEISNLYYVK